MTHRTHRFLLATALLCALTPHAVVADEKAPELVGVKRIWDQAPHNAFTDLVHFNGRWFCTFREGKGHVSDDGKARVIVSDDGKEWASAALLSTDNADVRDPKLCITPDGRLMLTATDSWHDKSLELRRLTKVWFSKDGEQWDGPTVIGEPNYWLWRVTWHDKAAWGIGYNVVERGTIRLYRSESGKKFDTHVADMKSGGAPNETALLFGEGGEALCLLRRDPQPGMVGSARPPYKQWTWTALDKRIGGPNCVRLPDGRLIAVVRLYDNPVRTSVCRINLDDHKVEELLKLPSGGDTSYAGLVWRDDLLWISYYASHEGKAAIYLARVRFGAARP